MSRPQAGSPASPASLPPAQPAALHGWLVVDKPAGISSAQVVARVKRASGAAKVGHGGTLDPMATGVLPIALNEATKTSAYAFSGTKQYSFTVCWGESRDSEDAQGAVTGLNPHRPDRAAIETALGAFLGKIEQVPPAFSALKIKGERAYKLARRQEEVSLAARVVRIDEFQLLEVPDCDHAIFSMTCGKGTYVRSLARDLAQALGTLGHVTALRRLRVGRFAENALIPLDYLESLGHSAALADRLLPLETVLDDIPALALSDEQALRIRHGQAVPLFAVKTLAGEPVTLADLEKDQVAQEGTKPASVPTAIGCGFCRKKPVALLRYEDGRLAPVRVFNL